MVLFDIDNIDSKIDNLSKLTLEPDFWSDLNKAKQINKELTQFQDKKNKINYLKKLSNDIEDTFNLLKIEYDSSFHQELENNLLLLENNITELETQLYLSGKYDSYSAILELHPGAGGTEAHDWAGMLFRMYQRYASRNKFKFKVLDYLESSENLLSSATVLVEGANAFGLLKSESGVHRLVRISPFDASASRHTSFASCNVIPSIDDSIEINIDEKDLEIKTCRSSGAGGQHVNKTESAVRILHKPTNIVVSCQVDRSQLVNKNMALNMLKAKLIMLEEKKKQEQMNQLHGEKKEIEWGSQIRSYVFNPYTLVKDHRTNISTSDVNSVMDGDLDLFINSYLKWRFEQNEK